MGIQSAKITFITKFLTQLMRSLDKLCQGINDLISAPEKLRSMTYFPHLRMAV